MERMNAYLRDLLILHDCVILPDFGGFVGNYKPAQKTEQDYFMPPRKVIAFNPQLKENDGLLANTIVAIENVNYNTAIQKVTDFTATINKELKATGSYAIPEVGILELKEEERLVFTPDAVSNLLATPVGFTNFQPMPIVAKKAEPKKKAKVVYFPVFRKVLVAGVSGFALLSLLFHSGNFKDESLASIFPLGNNSTVKSEAKTIPTKTVEVATLDKKPFEVKEQPILEAKPIATTTATEQTTHKLTKRYHVIAGCFSKVENAEKLQKKLSQKYENVQIFPHKNNLFAVSAGSFDSFKSAAPLMKVMRKNGDATSAWVLKRKVLN